MLIDPGNRIDGTVKGDGAARGTLIHSLRNEHLLQITKIILPLLKT